MLALSLWLWCHYATLPLTWEQTQLQIHLRRLAYLTVLAKRGSEQHDRFFVERVEHLRRQEVSRYLRQMKQRFIRNQEQVWEYLP
jgi:RNase P subunit RPR2